MWRIKWKRENISFAGNCLQTIDSPVCKGKQNRHSCNLPNGMLNAVFLRFIYIYNEGE